MVKDFQIIHQCGESQLQAVKTESEKIIKEGEGEYADAIKSNYKLYPFFDVKDMALAYAAADIIISRAGANNIFEISMLGKPVRATPMPVSSTFSQKLMARIVWAAVILATA